MLSNTFLSYLEASEVLAYIKDEHTSYEEIRNVHTFDQVIVEDEPLVDKIVSIFKESTNQTISSKPIIRCIRLSKGHKLITHTFGYNEGPYAKTKFGLVIRLGGEFTGGEYLYNGNEVDLDIGEGIIHTRDTRGKILEVETGQAYFLYCHIFDLETKNVI